MSTRAAIAVRLACGTLVLALACVVVIMLRGNDPDRPASRDGDRRPHSRRAPADRLQSEITDQALRAFHRVEAAIGPEGYSGCIGWELVWKESYVLMAYLAMYEATGDPQYADRFVQHVDRVLANRDDRRGLRDEVRDRIMPAWSTVKYSDGKRYAWLAHAGMITYPIARWVYIAKGDERLLRTYPTRIRTYWRDVVQCVGAFEPEWKEGPGAGEGHYWGPYLARGLPLNQQNALGRTFVAMYLASGNPEYRRRAQGLGRFLKNRLQSTGGKYVWPYWGDQAGVEDTSHGSISVDFAFACFRAGLVFDPDDMAAFARTFRGVVTAPGGFACRVDGTGGVHELYSTQAGRWLHLAFFDPDLRDLCYQWYKDRWESLEFTGLLTAAYLVQTGGAFTMDTPRTP